MVSFVLDFISNAKSEPKVSYYPIGSEKLFPDDSDKYRWRATWDDPFVECPTGILIRPFPVLKKTECGAWIDPYAYWHGEWVTSEDAKRWVSDTGNQAWAKPTKEAAVFSLAYRLQRWASNISRDYKRAMAATHAMKTLFPENAYMALNACKILESLKNG